MTAPRVSPREAQLGLGLVVEAGWLFAWSAGLGAWSDPLRAAPILGLPAIAVVLVVATLATRLALGWRARPGLARGVVSLLGVSLALLAATSVLLRESWPAVEASAQAGRAIGASILVLLAWWRGIVAGRARPSLDSAETGLRLAVAALAILFLNQAFAPRDEGSVGTLAGAALLVLAAGLLALPLAALLDQRDSSRFDDAAATKIGAHWLSLLIGAVAALLVLASLVAQTLTFERLDLLLRPLATALGALLWSCVYPVGILIGHGLELLLWLLERLVMPAEMRQRAQPPDLSMLDRLRERAGPPLPLDGTLATLISLLAGAAAVAVVGRLLARAVLRWADPGPGDGVEEIHDFIWSWRGLWSGLRRRLSGVRARPHQPRSAEQPRMAAEESPSGAARGVRELYRELLRLGARLGRRRAAHETPYEYERALVALGPLSAGRADVRRLTDVYAEARYSAAPPSPHAVAEARAALERLEALAAADVAADRKRP